MIGHRAPKRAQRTAPPAPELAPVPPAKARKPKPAPARPPPRPVRAARCAPGEEEMRALFARAPQPRRTPSVTRCEGPRRTLGPACALVVFECCVPQRVEPCAPGPGACRAYAKSVRLVRADATRAATFCESRRAFDGGPLLAGVRCAPRARGAPRLGPCRDFGYLGVCAGALFELLEHALSCRGSLAFVMRVPDAHGWLERRWRTTSAEQALAIVESAARAGVELPAPLRHLDPRIPTLARRVFEPRFFALWGPSWADFDRIAAKPE